MGRNRKSQRHQRQKVKWAETESQTDAEVRKLNGQKQKVKQQNEQKLDE